MEIWKATHGQLVHKRRTRQLARHIAEMLPAGARVLDVGCGDGLIAGSIAAARPDIEVRGIDVLVREKTHVPVAEFDGTTIPYDDSSFNVVVFVDVLHHTDDPAVLLAEARRVASDFVVIKDHTDDGFLSNARLRLMDWFGNKPHGVVLPYNYWREARWRSAFRELGLEIVEWRDRLGLYPQPADAIFGSGLHMIAKLKVN